MVLVTSHKEEVFDSIVRPLLVPMMNDTTLWDRSANMTFHYKNMLVDASISRLRMVRSIDLDIAS
jgi:hypothetical protein